MLSGMTDDLRFWMNYVPEPWPAELRRMSSWNLDPARLDALTEFGFRPHGLLDEEPAAMPVAPSQPFEITDEMLNPDDVVVDIATGYRFRRLPEASDLVFDLIASRSYTDAQELLMLAALRGSHLPFQSFPRPTYIAGPTPYTAEPRQVQPLALTARSRTELETALNDLSDLFCGRCGAHRLWLRGQRQEYVLPRSAELCQRYYGSPSQPSLLPSAGRYAFGNPEKLGFSLAFAGPNHFWKKPFLAWLMRDNADWFREDPRPLEVLSRVLSEDDDEPFTKMLMAIQMGAFLPELGGGIPWPDEADDLRQWFFAFMKTHSFAVTLQQYGYITTLLDLTTDLDVALYFTEAQMSDGAMRKRPPGDERILYVFTERRSGDFFRHGRDLFWGDEGWTKNLPPRLERQKAGFLLGSHARAQNFYGSMVVARIALGSGDIRTSLGDADLFPSPEHDLLYRTLLESRPPLEGLY